MVKFAVYDYELMAGLILYCIYEDGGEYWIYPMIIDKKHRSKGYGRKNVKKLIEVIEEDKTRYEILSIFKI